jgi:hypothetical protein
MRPLLLLLALMLAAQPAFAADEKPPWEEQDEPEGDDDDDDDEPAPSDEPPADEPADEPAPDEPAPDEPAPEEPPARQKPTRERNSPAKPRPAPPGSVRSGGPVGLGFVVGTNNGFSLKIWPTPAHGIVLHLGVPLRLNSGALALSYRFHPPAIGMGKFAQATLQLGPVFRTRLVGVANALFVELGGGLVVGGSVTFRKAPVELFVEVAPLFAGGVAPTAGTGLGFDVDGLAGLRFYLGV